MQSIFTDIGKVDFRDPCSYQLIPTVPGLSPNSSASAAWLSSDGEALFALPSASGGISVLKLPPHAIPGMVSIVELKQFSNATITYRLDASSYQDQMCLMVADMLEYVPGLAAGTGHKLRLAYSPSLGLYLGVYMHAPKHGQFCIFQLVSTENNRYSLDHISSLFTSQVGLSSFACRPSTRTKSSLALLFLNGTEVLKLQYFMKKYSRPSISMGSTSVDSTNRRLKIFGKEKK
ncbi:nuclear pore complex protein Nup160-like isoform X2 [Trichechus manatus latirostris]|nr:nuclear pore complex protein Nup160-like isoform X2 [Trichechus manatus latirostris]